MYAEISVDQMLNGKAVSRAVRAHLLVDRAFNTIATSQMCDVPIPNVSPVASSLVSSSIPDNQRNTGNYYDLQLFHQRMTF